MKYLILAFTLLFAGCSFLEDKPNNAAAFTSDQILALATQVERAQATGLLSEDEGDGYLDLLVRANKLLSGSVTVYSDVIECQDSQSKFQCIDSILSTVEGAL